MSTLATTTMAQGTPPADAGRRQEADRLRPAANHGARPDRPRLMRKRKRIGGRDVLVKNTASKDNARTPAIRIVHGANSPRARQGRLDKRTVEARVEQAEIAALTAHVGGDPNAVVQRLIHEEARYAVLCGVAWTQLMDAGVILKGDTVHPALEAFIKLSKERRAVLALLGLNRGQKQIVDVAAELARMPQEPGDGAA